MSDEVTVDEPSEPGKINPEAAALADIPPGLGPEIPAGENQAEPEEERDLAIEARMTVELMEGLVRMQWPYVSYQEPAKQAVADKLEPVLRKYDVLPPWLKNWEEEIALGMVLAGVAYETYQIIQAHKAREDGEKSTNQTSEPQHTVHSQVRSGEEPGDDAEPGDTQESGTDDFMG